MDSHVFEIPYIEIDDHFDELDFTDILPNLEIPLSQTYTPNIPMDFPTTNEDFLGISGGESVAEDSCSNNLGMHPPFNRESTINESDIKDRYTTSPGRECSPTLEQEHYAASSVKERYTTSPDRARYAIYPSNDDFRNQYMSEQISYEAYESESQNFGGFHDGDMQTTHEIDSLYPDPSIELPSYLEPRINMDDDRHLHPLGRLLPNNHQRNTNHQFRRTPGDCERRPTMQVVDEPDFRRRLRSQRARQPSDFPEDVIEQKKIVKRIFDAIKSVDEAVDSDKVKAMFKDDKVPDLAIEIASWELMLRTRDSQEYGQLVPAFQKTRYEQWESFNDRMNEIIDILKQSKSVCKQILQPSYIDRVADQPKAEHIRKGCNQKLNKKKATQNKLGKMVIEAGLDVQIKEIAHQQKQASLEESLSFAPISRSYEGLGISENYAEPRVASAKLAGINPISRSASGQRAVDFEEDEDAPVSKKRRRLEIEDEAEYPQKMSSKSRTRKTSRRQTKP